MNRQEFSNLEIMFENSKNPPQSYRESFGVALDDMISIFDTLFNFACTLSGFQFIGIIFDKTVLEDSDFFIEISYFFLALGFVFSLFSAFLSYISLHFLKTIRFENGELINTSIIKYKPIFYFAYITLFINSGCFLIPINIFVHNLLSLYFAIIINIISCLIFIIGIIIYVIMIQRKQIFKINDGSIVQRTVYYNN
jgi:hypothetical protein